MKIIPLFRQLLATFLFVISSLAWAEPIDINTASAVQLSTLKGIGPSKAEAIVRYRTEHGAFTSIDQLVNVKGIGHATLRKNEGRLSLNGLMQETASNE